jgi:7-cyano-7-deazaguanine synthase
MKTMVVFSGGADSTTLLYYLREYGHQLTALTVNYQQRHVKEVECAIRICQGLNITYKTLDLSAVGRLLSGSQTDLSVSVPHGHYTADNMKDTVVPNRNMILLAVAAGVAISESCDAIAYGAHAGDHTIYPDCRPGFIRVMREAFLNCDWRPLQLLAPFQDWSKGQIIQEGLRLGVPYQHTWTCYEGKEYPCGLCGACTERKEAFREAGAKDPGEHDAVYSA